MHPNQASRTAEYMALFRALESSRPSSCRLFTDPFAQGLLRPSLRIASGMARVPVVGRVIPWIIDRKWPGARGSCVGRTRFIDDALLRALHDGVEQVVILGAGFDCRGYRLVGMDRVRVIEVDHSDTGKAKRERLQRLLGRLPDHVHFAAMDFNREHLQDVLAPPVFDGRRKTFFLWEGVTQYLSAPAVDATFQAIRRLAECGTVLFTYVDKAVIDAPNSFKGTGSLNQILQRAGEAWTFGFDPSELPDYLEKHGFRLVEDVSFPEYRRLYMGAKVRLPRGYEFSRIAIAESQTTLASSSVDGQAYEQSKDKLKTC